MWIKSYIWDTGALSLFFAGNEVAIKLMRNIEKNNSTGYIPQLVFSELYYKSWQKLGKQAALIRIKTLKESSLNEYILNETDTFVVGKAKLDYSFLSMVDAVVVASAIATKSTIITSDKDFLGVKGVKVIKLKF